MELIRLEQVVKYYKLGKVDVLGLDNVSSTIEDGEYVAIMGPSGSGKSTLMNILGLLDVPTSGRYFLEGKDVSDLSEAEQAKVRNRTIGFVFQTFNLLPRQTLLENVELPMIYAGIGYNKRKKLAIEMLERVGLGHRVNHRPNEISGGERQRVAISRALVNNPKIILADEPTGNLDSKSGEAILNIFNELNAQGKTVILVTHSEKIAGNARRIIHLFDGRIIGEERK